MTFGYIGEAQRLGLIEDIDQFNGKHTDVLMITDPTSAQLARDTIWGLNQEVTPVGQPFHETYSKTFRIKERL